MFGLLMVQGMARKSMWLQRSKRGDSDRSGKKLGA